MSISLHTVIRSAGMAVYAPSCLLVASALCIASYYRNRRHGRHATQPACPSPNHPHTIFFAFDLHGVLFTPEYRKIIAYLWRMPHKGPLLLLALRPTFIIRCLMLLAGGMGVEEFLSTLHTRYPLLDRYRGAISDVVNMQRPQFGTFAVARELRKRGYHVTLFSNIGSHHYRALSQQFGSLLKVFEGHTLCDDAQRYTCKPHATAFNAYLQQFHCPAAQVIFVDDRQRNIRAGQTAGMYSILYRDSSALHAQLARLGFL